ncbi:MAG: MerR family transcriptional regulator [Bacilli bacterium]|nr:MerR family transcriptional regulator [Bacilli bacterium]
MYRIGDFSKMTGASVKTLRYYDEINLLKPVTIDNFTNYRYYSDKEIEVFKKIEHLKKLGFTLEEIKNNISNMSLECLDAKKQELSLKIEYMMAQINGIDELKNELSKRKVKTYKN